MYIANNILKHALRNCYFLNGTAYAGKSTMCAMLAERYHMIHCGENYGLEEMRAVADPILQPNLSYTSRMNSWQDFILRSPDEYEQWVQGNSLELAQFEVAELIRRSASGQKLIVDTNIPCELLWQISDYDHVAILLSPQSMSVDHFFDREDEEKQFLLSVIRSCPDPDAAMANFKACLARINSPECFEAFRSSGFFTLVRQNTNEDTREETLAALARHFRLDEPAAESQPFTEE